MPQRPPGPLRLLVKLFALAGALCLAAAGHQPPERPPEDPPEETAVPPAEDEPQPPQPPSGEEQPPGPAGEAEAGGDEPPGEGSPDAESDPDEPAEEPEADPRPTAPAVAAPPGILPAWLLAEPVLTPENPVVQIILLEHGAAARSAAGAVFVLGDGEAAPRWRISTDAVFAAAAPGGIVVLDREGGVQLYRTGDGIPLGGFTSGLPPEGEGAAGPPAAFADGALFWISGGALHGFTAPGGERVLEVALPGHRVSALVPVRQEPTDADRLRDEPPQLIIASLGGGGVAAVPASDSPEGQLVWTAPDLGEVTAPVLVLPGRGLVVAAGASGTLSALRLEDGRRRWRWRLREGFDHPPSANGDQLLAATRANTLYAFDLPGGAEQWRTALPGRPAAAPIRLAGTLVAAMRDGLVLELNPRTGIVVGRPRDLGSEILGAVAGRGDEPRRQGWRARRLYLGLRDGRLAVLAPSTGAEAETRPSSRDDPGRGGGILRLPYAPAAPAPPARSPGGPASGPILPAEAPERRLPLPGRFPR